MKHMTHRRSEQNFLLSLSLAIFKSPFQSYLEPLYFPLIHWNVSLEGDRRLVWYAFPVGHRKICTGCFLSGTVLDTYALFTFYQLAKEIHLPGRAQRTPKHRGVTVLKMAWVPTGRVRLLTRRIPSPSSWALIFNLCGVKSPRCHIVPAFLLGPVEDGISPMNGTFLLESLRGNTG